MANIHAAEEAARKLGAFNDGDDAFGGTTSNFASDLNAMWLCLGAILVFFMQTGFAMLEVGTVSKKNTSNILLKNVLDASVGSITWWLLGFSFAMGDAQDSHGFIGSRMLALNYKDFQAWGSGFPDDDGFGHDSGYTYAIWLFQWAFAATTATIVSGAVAERCSFTAYISYSIFLTGFVYPVVVCWGWNTTGWASAWKSVDIDQNPLLAGCGVIDFAGSGVVHMTGGVAAFVGCALLGARKARQPVAGQGLVDLPSDYAPEYGPIFQTLGTLILWMGWYGFNGVSTLYIVNYGMVAAKTMVTTTIAAGTGAITTLFLGSFMDKAMGKTAMYTLKLSNANNGVLAGLVSITAGCSTCEPYGAFIIGMTGSVVYLLSSDLLVMLKIDDVVGAIPVHGFCGFWGVLMAAFFATENNYANAYYSDRAKDCAGLLYGGDGSAMAAAIQFLLAVIVWVAALSAVMFGALSAMNLLRVDAIVEDEGMDKSEHGVTTGYAAADTGATEMVEKDAGSNL